MSTVDASKARSNLASILELAKERAVTVERYGQPAAVIISPERHDFLLDALEELEDIRAFDEAMDEAGDNVSWEQAKADLGWT